MKIKYTELVETGHLKEVGGTLEISVITNENDWNDSIIDIIDKLDHTTIIPKSHENLKTLSDRYFIVEGEDGFIKSAFAIIKHFLQPLQFDYKVEIKYGKFTYYFDRYMTTDIRITEISKELQ